MSKSTIPPSSFYSDGGPWHESFDKNNGKFFYYNKYNKSQWELPITHPALNSILEYEHPSTSTLSMEEVLEIQTFSPL